MLVVLAMFAASATAGAQHGSSAPAPNRTAPAEAAQFNFLVGQWELVVKPAASGLAQRIHGVPKLVGVWKAWRALDGWGIEDELRVTDASCNPVNLTHATRYYDRTSKTWKSSAIDVYRGVFTSSTSQFANGQMTSTSRGTDADGKAYLTRGRFSGISRNTFRFVQERSTDNGKSWDENLTIEAKRVSATASR
jgi:hypothetical protein